ncbi:TVB4 protein, partial [Atractosteus spatula]|nr:TVB4 protein [Atractosteus spatula]
FFKSLIFVSAGNCQKISVSQTPSIAWNKTGESAEIRCEHQGGADYSSMYWFRQLPGEKIQLIVYSSVGGDPDFGEFSKEKYDVIKTKAQKGSFTVKNLEPGDTATYFCAAGKHSDAELLHSLSKTPPAIYCLLSRVQ